jgi:1,2-diacylglycerol 3-alpha-glucosyltransferase
MRIAVMFNRFGPYHLARLDAAGSQGDLIGIEVVTRDRTYAWDLARGAERFERITLFREHEGARPPTAELARRLYEVLNRMRPDAIGLPGWSRKAGLLALGWCLRHGVPAVVMSESNRLDQPRAGWLEAAKRRIVRLFSAGLAGGSRSADYLAELGLPRPRIFTCYDVVDNEHFSRAAAAVRLDAGSVRRRYGLPQRYFLSVSRLVAQKNVPALLEAYALYRSAQSDRAWSLMLVGDGPERSLIEAKIRDLGLGGYVTMPGFQQYAELPAFYGLAEAFVLASTCEPWGLVVNEAMATGLPVLVSHRCGCAPDLVEAGGNGFVFNPRDPRDLAGCMVAIAADACDRAGMRARSRAIIERWSPDDFARNLWRSGLAARSVALPAASLADRVLLWGLS